MVDGGARPASVVVGLGNPGPAYAGTRHNVGHLVVEQLARRLGAPFRRVGAAQIADAVWRGVPLALVKLLAVMNASGPALAEVLRALGADRTALVLVHDDIDLPFGTVRTRLRGRSAGHRGLASVLETLGTTDVRRVKVGVGRPATKGEVSDWVLAPFAPEERQVLPDVLDRAADAALALTGVAPP